MVGTGGALVPGVVSYGSLVGSYRGRPGSLLADLRITQPLSAWPHLKYQLPPIVIGAMAVIGALGM
jgi:hypothetical protein